MARVDRLEDDGLVTPDIGAWGERKYRLVANYSAMFARSMRRKWECLVYIDLFSGAGRARLRGSKQIVAASPLRVLGIPVRFDRYIFCENDVEQIEALRKRIATAFPEALPNCRFTAGDANQSVDALRREIPQYSKTFHVLTFCFADPFKLRNLRFETIRTLSDQFVDHLVLIPTGMDARRNLNHYLRPRSTMIADFTGQPEWRKAWQEAEAQGTAFEVFLTNCFARSMQALDYRYPGIDHTQLIRSTPKNLPLYRLAMFSRHELGGKFWDQARKYSTDQLDLFT